MTTLTIKALQEKVREWGPPPPRLFIRLTRFGAKDKIIPVPNIDGPNSRTFVVHAIHEQAIRDATKAHGMALQPVATGLFELVLAGAR